MPAQGVVRCIRNVGRKKKTQKSIAHLAFLFRGGSLKTAYLHNTKAFVIYTLHRTRAVRSYRYFLDTLRFPVLDSARKITCLSRKTAWVRLCKVYITNDLWLRKYTVFNVRCNRKYCFATNQTTIQHLLYPLNNFIFINLSFFLFTQMPTKLMHSLAHLENFTNQPLGYWNNKLMRTYMEDVAKKFNMDPLLPSTWYSIPYQDIYQSKVFYAYIIFWPIPPPFLLSIWYT
jgi:hypothetical protein